MTQFWIYTTVFFIGALCGTVLGVVVDQGPTYRNTIGKIKQKRSPGGVIDVLMDALPGEKSKREQRRERRKKRREERRAGRGE